MTVHTGFDPKKYGMIFCPNCHGRGKFIHDALGTGVCKACGGFGLIKRRKETDGPHDDFVLAHEFGFFCFLFRGGSYEKESPKDAHMIGCRGV